MLACATVFFSCSKTEEPVDPPTPDGDDSTAVTEPEKPSVTLTEGPVSETTISFTIIPENAEECAYLITEKQDGAEVPDAETIFKDGELLAEVKSQLVEKEGMEAGTKYVVTAAVRNQDLTAVSEQLILKTDSIAQGTTMEVTISDVSATTSTITFTVTCANAGKAAYDVVEKGVEEHTPADVMFKGKEIPTQEHQTITVEGKKDNTTYVIYAVVEAADSYDRVMETYEITTEKLPDPEETDVEKFTDGTFKIYGGGRNYVITTANENYEINLDFYCDDANAYMPYIASHEYTYEKAGSTSDWTIGTMSYISELPSGDRLSLEKGSFTSSVENGEYTIKGQFVTTENVEFKFEITGHLDFIISNPYGLSAESSKTDNGMNVNVKMDSFGLSLIIASDVIAGTHTVGQDITAQSAFTLSYKSGSFGLESGTVTFEDKGDDYYIFSADLVLEGGYPVKIDSDSYMHITTPVIIDDEQILFTSAEAYAVPDLTGYAVLYTLDLDSDEWEVSIEFCDYGNYDELPVGTIQFASWLMGGEGGGAGEITGYRISNKATGETIDDLDEGSMIISLDGDTYEVVIDIARTGGNSFKGKYTGPIVCEDYSGLGY